MPFPFAAGSDDCVGQACWWGMFFQSPGKLNIFHDGDIRVAAAFKIESPLNEHGMITGYDAG